MSKFKDFWSRKSHDIPIQHELDDVKNDVHELDERVDQYEDAKGNLKPGIHVDKTTVHLTYDKNGDFVGSYVDENTKKGNVKKMDVITGSHPERAHSAGKILRWGAKQPVIGRIFTGIDNLNHRHSYEQALEEDRNKGIFPSFQVSKPGPSIHTSDWDKCVEDVKRRGNASNAYAVCTAQLGEQSFKSEYRHLSYTKSLIANAKKSLGIGFAGPVPNSLLAGQDLEGEEREKGVADDASLYDLKDEAENAGTKTEKEEVGDKIKEVQIDRQKAALEDRRKSSDSGQYDIRNSRNEGEGDNAEQKWVLLKRDRKELQDLVSSLQKKLETMSSDQDSVQSKLTEATGKLTSVNQQIDETLESLKQNG